MTEKRFTTIESGIDYGVIDNATNERIFDVNITTKLNELSEENEQLKKANDRLLFRIVDMLDYIKNKGAVTHNEMREWWNNSER